MPRVVIKANELVGTDLNFVSLVAKGANRIPFRIVKEDNEAMLDLHSIQRKLFKAADPVPSVLAVLAKGVDVTEALASAGLDSLTKSEQDGVETFAKADASVPETETALIKLSDEVSLVVHDVAKAFSSYDMASTSFMDVAKAGGFYPSVSIASDCLLKTIGSIMMEADSPAKAASSVAKAVDEFKAYLTTMTKGLPVQAFKFDVELAKAAKKVKGKGTTDSGSGDGADNDADDMKKATNGTGDGFAAGDGTGTDSKATADDANNSIEAKQRVAKGMPGADATAGGVRNDGTGKGFAQTPADSNRAEDADDTESAGVTAKNRKGKAKKEDGEGDDLSASIAALAKSLTEGLAAINTKVDTAVTAMKAEVAAVSSEVSKAADLARKSDEAVRGTVIGDAGDDKTGVRKSDASSGESFPLLDTAFMKRDAA